MENRSRSLVLEAPDRLETAPRTLRTRRVTEWMAGCIRPRKVLRALCTAFEDDGAGRDALRLLDRCGEAFWLARAPGAEIAYASRALGELWGRSVAALVADPALLEEGIHPQDRMLLGPAPAGLRTRALRNRELRILRPDGSLRCVRLRSLRVPGRRRPGAQRVVVGLAEDLTDRKQAEERARQSEEDLRALVAELVVSEERERRRLARDLHDGLDQTLALARLRVSCLLRRPASAPLQSALCELAHLLEEGLEAARTLTVELSPPVLHDLGLVPALEALAESLQDHVGLAVSVEASGSPAQLGEETRVLLFRSARELLINVAKHAGVERAWVGVRRTGSELVLSVRDEGVGFDLRAMQGSRRTGFGLFDIGQRLQHLGGRVEIRSAPGEGTEVVLTTPLRPLDGG